VKTEDLLLSLRRLPEAPWGDYEGKPITEVKFAEILRAYGLRSKQERVGAARARGYLRSEFSDVFDRYLAPGRNPFETASTRDTHPQPMTAEAHNQADVTAVTGYPPLGANMDAAA
jgi:Protein of unknown function (DUF3631)